MSDENLAQAETSTTETAGGNTTPETVIPVAEAPSVETSQDTALDTIPAPSAEPVLAVGGMEGYQKMLADAEAGVDPFATAVDESTTATVETKPTPVQTAEAAPAVIEEPPAAAVEQDPPVAAAATTDDDGKVPDRVRLTGLSDKSRAKTQAAILLAKAEGIEVDEAMARLNGTPRVAAAVEQAAPAPPVYRSEDVIKADIDALKAQKKAAAGELDTLKMLEFDDQIETLRDEMNESRRGQAEQFANFERDVTATNARTVQFYPDAGVEGSEFQAAMVAMADRLEAQGNPVVHQADASLRIAQMVANERGIAPVAPGAAKPTVSKPAAVAAVKPSTPAKPQPVPQKAVGRPQTSAAAPASGAARTAPPGPPAGLPKIRTQLDYDKYVHETIGA